MGIVGAGWQHAVGAAGGRSAAWSAGAGPAPTLPAPDLRAGLSSCSYRRTSLRNQLEMMMGDGRPGPRACGAARMREWREAGPDSRWRPALPAPRLGAGSSPPPFAAVRSIGRTRARGRSEGTLFACRAFSHGCAAGTGCTSATAGRWAAAGGGAGRSTAAAPYRGSGSPPPRVCQAGLSLLGLPVLVFAWLRSLMDPSPLVAGTLIGLELYIYW